MAALLTYILHPVISVIFMGANGFYDIFLPLALKYNFFLEIYCIIYTCIGKFHNNIQIHVGVLDFKFLFSVTFQSARYIEFIRNGE